MDFVLARRLVICAERHLIAVGTPCVMAEFVQGYNNHAKKLETIALPVKIAAEMEYVKSAAASL